jgi:hypothetical protein
MAGALAALATLACLPACTPPEKAVTALRLVDGHPTLLILSCSDFQIDSVSVYQDDDSVSPRPVWRIRREGGPVPGQLRLLQTPAGWSATEESLSTLRPGTEYGIAAFAEARPAVPINFTLAELDALGPDQVLVGKSASRREAVSESAFRKKAKRSC